MAPLISPVEAEKERVGSGGVEDFARVEVGGETAGDRRQGREGEGIEGNRIGVKVLGVGFGMLDDAPRPNREIIPAVGRRMGG